jgi:hypothetical protein
MAESQSEEIRAIMLEAARVQVATLNAGIAFWSGWVEAAGKFVQATSRELVTAGDPDMNVDALVGRLTDSSREYLRRVTELPRAAVAQFEADLQTRDAGKSGKRARVARAKA